MFSTHQALARYSVLCPVLFTDDQLLLILNCAYQNWLRLWIEYGFCIVFNERVMGIEPTLSAWKAGILPLNYTRAGVSPCNYIYIMYK
jgi:hypothetical protein